MGVRLVAPGARLVELHPMTIMQNALHSFGGDWSWVPPKAATIGPREVLGARHRSFWLDGDLGGGVAVAEREGNHAIRDQRIECAQPLAQ